MRKLIIFAIAAGIAACADLMPQKAAEPDTSPTNPTAVFETHVINGGIVGFFPSESTEKRYVRTHMRREDNSTKGTGTFTGYFRQQWQGQVLIYQFSRMIFSLWT